MNRLQKYYVSFLKNIQLQLFISLISLPFLVSWGLPISIVSVFTTLLFTPFLTAFLLVSSLIFFFNLLHLPHAFFIRILECITYVWTTCLSFNQQWWLIGFTKPSIICLLFIVPATLAIMHNKNIKTAESRILFLTIFLICTCLVLKFFPYPYNGAEKIMHHNKHLSLINYHNQLVCIDNGVFSIRPSYESFILYTLMPEIVQKTGRMSIDHLIIRSINTRTFNAVAFLSTKMNIKNIYLPWWTGKIPSYAWKSYMKFKQTISVSGGKIIPISKKRSLFKSQEHFLFIEPDNSKNIHYYDASYPTLVVNGVVRGENISL